MYVIRKFETRLLVGELGKEERLGDMVGKSSCLFPYYCHYTVGVRVEVSHSHMDGHDMDFSHMQYRFFFFFFLRYVVVACFNKDLFQLTKL